jgi:P27 family predicted phage terminase small subunit
VSRNARTGRPPKPHHLKVIEGNAGKRRLQAPPKATPEKPRCPGYLTPYGKTTWRRLVVILDDLGVLTAADRDTMAALCEAVSRFKAATELIAKTDVLVKGERGPVKNPAVQIQRDAARDLATFSAMFGLSPADRVRLLGAGNAGRGGRGDELEGLLGA